MGFVINYDEYIINNVLSFKYLYMHFPEKLHYTKNHLWINQKSYTIYIGLTDYAQNQYGHITYVDVNAIGENLEKYRIFGSVETVHQVHNLIMPFNGRIIEFNGELDRFPSLVNDDPYGAGWIVKVELDDLAGTEKLLSSKEYIEYINTLKNET